MRSLSTRQRQALHLGHRRGRCFSDFAYQEREKGTQDNIDPTQREAVLLKVDQAILAYAEVRVHHEGFYWQSRPNVYGAFQAPSHGDDIF